MHENKNIEQCLLSPIAQIQFAQQITTEAIAVCDQKIDALTKKEYASYKESIMRIIEDVTTLFDVLEHKRQIAIKFEEKREYEMEQHFREQYQLSN